jgi:hypothetical protein
MGFSLQCRLSIEDRTCVKKYLQLFSHEIIIDQNCRREKFKFLSYSMAEKLFCATSKDRLTPFPLPGFALLIFIALIYIV